MVSSLARSKWNLCRAKHDRAVMIVRDGAERWRAASSQRRQSHQPDTQRGRPVPQVFVNSVTPSSTSAADRTAEHIRRHRYRQLQTDVDVLALSTTVRILYCRNVS